ncbi:LysR family transcriptional regulator [Actinomadura litoris]|uniref:LysR family transcriptional regulator n=1 Tax=Actinomadura litoris TaxID=2678616 RepID=A0A7K1KTC9_9ACTN|nr:LysR family transcriptional regulator [Actinomadura litoris]MUN35444.1 LysR family transcriptional regulator [Actinomadura litoris]
MFDFLLLQALCAVRDHGSLTGAAEALYITPSAVSQRIAKLERETGQPMVERAGRGVALTGAAMVLVGYGERILSLVDEAEAILEGHRGTVAGRLSVAGFSTAVRGLLPTALGAMRVRYPDLAVEVSELEPGTASTRVARGELDVAIVQDWFNAPLELPDGLLKAPLLDDVVDIALPDSHRLAGCAVVGVEELAGEEWITWPVGAVCHGWLLRTFAEPRVVHTAAEHPTQLALVAAGLGVCVLPRLGRDEVPPGVTVAEVRPVLSRHVYAVWRREAARRPAIGAMVEELAAAAGYGAAILERN